MDRYHHALVDIFRRASSKHEAHRLARPVLQDMSDDPRVLTAVLREYLSAPGSLNVRNYPVVGMEWRLNEWFGLVINCWIPLPDRSTALSTKSIHHHGNMLLSTATLFGPGYEHWTFTKPRVLDAGEELYRFHVLEKSPHPVGHVSFVDAHIPHLPWYPAELSITCCLWSNQFPTTWRDRVKRIPLLKQNEKLLRKVATATGADRFLNRALDVKVIEYYDFYPTPGGFKGMRERQEYERGPCADHVCSVFHVLQQTHHQDLAPLVEDRLRQGGVEEPALVERLLGDLRADRPIEGKLSSCHLDLPHTTFTRQDVDRSVQDLDRRQSAAATAAA